MTDLTRRLTAIRLAPGKHTRAERDLLRRLEAVCRQDGHDDLHAGRCKRCGLVPIDTDGEGLRRAIEERAAKLTARAAPEPDRAEHEATMHQAHGARRASGIPTWHQRRGLADITPDAQQKAAHDTLTAWVADQRTANPKPRGLLLLGPIGTGKTTLAAAAAVDLREPDGCLFRSTRDLIAAEKAAMGTDEEPMREAARARVLFLDDLAAVRETGWRVDELRGLLDARHDSCRVTVCTANLTSQQLGEMLGERTWSRLRSTADVVAVAGPDRRTT